MITRDTVKDKIIEVDLRISALEKLKANSNNSEGFDTLIKDLKKKKEYLLKLKI